jgi:hypothetical protein
MTARDHRLSASDRESRKYLRGGTPQPRRFCRGLSSSAFSEAVNDRTAKCAQTPIEEEIEPRVLRFLDCRAAMLQAISIGRGVPMLEPSLMKFDVAKKSVDGEIVRNSSFPFPMVSGRVRAIPEWTMRWTMRSRATVPSSAVWSSSGCDGSVTTSHRF